jgi:hypothetical protein
MSTRTESSRIWQYADEAFTHADAAFASANKAFDEARRHGIDQKTMWTSSGNGEHRLRFSSKTGLERGRLTWKFLKLATCALFTGSASLTFRAK